MESNRLDIAGKEETVSPPASYKKISEADLEQGVTDSETAKMVQTPDGANEKMLPSNEKKVDVDSKVDASEVKFITGEKQNGDAKIDLGDVRPTFVGMGKEELMRYANDPFWVRLRWILFILFWLVWILMLVGAVAIIIAAPKCAPPSPRTWWQQGPLAEINPSTASSEYLKKLSEMGVKGVIVTPGPDAYDLTDSSVDIVKTFIGNAKNFSLNVIVELKPSGTDLFLNKSEHKEDGFTDYYIWADPKGVNESGSPVPPNNWLSPNGDSAWKYSETRKQFYLAQLNAPDLNFRNDTVVDGFSKVIKSWLHAGAKGIRLVGANYLFVDPAFRNEDQGPNNPSITSVSYEFYLHKYTKGLSDIALVLNTWREIIKNETNGDGILTLAEDVDSLDPFKLNETLTIDLPRHSGVFNLHARNASATYLYNGLTYARTILEDAWPAWKYSEGSLSLDVLDIVVSLLPGTPIITKRDFTESYTTLVNARNTPSVMFGDLQAYRINGESVFAYTRVKPGNPGYLVAVNPSANNVTVNFVEQIPEMSDDLTVLILSENYPADGINVKNKIPATTVPIPSKSAVILTYVPKTE